MYILIDKERKRKNSNSTVAVQSRLTLGINKDRWTRATFS